MTARLQRWFKVAAFLLTLEDSTLSVDEREGICIYPASNISGLGAIKALVWMIVSIVFSLSVCLL